jgi:cysteinyl-tRNA synthetase
VTLRLHDTAFGELREFRPADPARVTMYMCGAPVHGSPGVGQMRSAVSADILIRWLEASGHTVILCRGVPDLDDRILNAARLEGIPWWQLAERNQRLLRDAHDLLGCRPPDVEPKAAGHVPQIIRLIARLVETGHAYQAAGNVYYDVATDPGYGTLSRGSQRQAKADAGEPPDPGPEPGPDPDPPEQRDFTLWKAAKPAEPSWDAPWGPGRPGSYMACSAMAIEYLGPGFDIHGGGLDLLFPHHENERAQSEVAGHPYARHWWHNATAGATGAPDADLAGALIRVRPVELRYYLVQAQYRRVLGYSEDGLEEAAGAYQRIERFVTQALESLGGHEFDGLDLPVSFTAAMDEDLGVPCALASVHAAVHDGNKAIADGDRRGLRQILTMVRSMLTVLGLDPLAPHWLKGMRNERLQKVVNGLVTLVIGQREKARERQDYSTADSISEGLEKIGVIVEDTVNGPRWELRR